MSAIDKLRAIVNWANFQNESFNQKFSDIKSLEKLYDYAQKHDLEFMDTAYLYSGDLEKEEIESAVKFIKTLK